MNDEDEPVSVQLAITLPPLDRSGAMTLHEQIYAGLRAAMLSGQIPGGTRLPASRRLAAELGVSRNTVTLAFDQLTAEGYLEARVGAGTFVRSSLPDRLLEVGRAARTASGDNGIGLSRRGALLGARVPAAVRRPDHLRAFWPGLPDLTAFPLAIWSKLVDHYVRRPDPTLLGYGDPAGYYPLREAIAAYLATTRGVHCDARQVVVVPGSQAALSLCSRLLLDPGDGIAIEDPGYPGAREAFQATGATLIPVPVDAEGIRLPEPTPPDAARLVYTTPSHQFPTGVTMSIGRRLALLAWAREVGAWILEDDYDGEYRYGGRPLPASQGLDEDGRVIYIGTFSKVLAPGIRIGYIVAPPALVDAFVAARVRSDRGAPQLEQAALADLITDGHFSRHIRRTRNLYAERQATFVDLVSRELAGLIDVKPAEAGMHLIAWLPDGTDDREVSRLAAPPLRVAAPALSTYALAAATRPGLVLGYAAPSDTEMRDGVRDLGIALRTLARRQAVARSSE